MQVSQAAQQRPDIASAAQEAASATEIAPEANDNVQRLWRSEGATMDGLAATGSLQGIGCVSHMHARAALAPISLALSLDHQPAVSSAAACMSEQRHALTHTHTAHPHCDVPAGGGRAAASIAEPLVICPSAEHAGLAGMGNRLFGVARGSTEAARLHIELGGEVVGSRRGTAALLHLQHPLKSFCAPSLAVWEPF
jgi:hypothetical protein